MNYLCDILLIILNKISCAVVFSLNIVVIWRTKRLIGVVYQATKKLCFQKSVNIPKDCAFSYQYVQKKSASINFRKFTKF